MTDNWNNDDDKAATGEDRGEFSFEEAFTRLLTNEACHDIILRGSDGVEVRANRFALATRSQFFDTMLLGKYAESTSDVVNSKYPGAVVKDVVEYIHTGKAENLKVRTAEKSDNDISDSDIAQIHSLVQLSGAASYYNLPGLEREVYRCICVLIRQNPCLSFTLFDDCHQRGPETPEVVRDLALRSLHLETLSPRAAGAMSSMGLEAILKEQKLEADEAALFELIRLWSTVDASAEEDRSSIATEFVEKHIRLELIDPELLSTTVATSGLVTYEQQAAAFQHQALEAKRNYSINFKKRRFDPPIGTWKSTLTDVITLDGSNGGKTELLNLASTSMETSKVYTWTIKLEEASEDCFAWLGIVSVMPGSVIDLNQFLGDCKYAWGFSNDGGVWIDGSQERFEDSGFRPGTEVTLTLDLLENREFNGTFDCDKFEESQGMCNVSGDVKDRNVFLAVSIKENSVARFRFIKQDVR